MFGCFKILFSGVPEYVDEKIITKNVWLFLNLVLRCTLICSWKKEYCGDNTGRAKRECNWADSCGSILSATIVLF
jgi:hypothetical protein